MYTCLKIEIFETPYYGVKCINYIHNIEHKWYKHRYRGRDLFLKRVKCIFKSDTNSILMKQFHLFIKDCSCLQLVMYNSYIVMDIANYFNLQYLNYSCLKLCIDR